MKYSFTLYLFMMAFTTYMVRLLPLLLVRKKIQNRFILSMLHYIPYAVLSAMTIPACFFISRNTISGIAGFLTALLLSYRGKSLLYVAAGAALAVFIAESVIILI